MRLFPLIEQGPRTFEGSGSSNGLPPTTARLPSPGLISRIEPAAAVPPTGVHFTPERVHCPPVFVALLARKRWLPFQTPPAAGMVPPSEPAVPMSACHTSTPLSRRYARNQPSLFDAPTMATPFPVKRIGLDA